MKAPFISKLHTELSRRHRVLQPKNGKGQRLNTSIFILDDEITAEIVTKKNQSILISASDVELVIGLNWHIGNNGYAVKNNPCEYLHRIITKASVGQMVDHINGEKLDNRRSNLRLCSASGNAQNKRMLSSNKSGFKGVYLQRETGNYISRISVNNRTKHLGSYKTAEEAFEIYCLAADMLYGEFANYGGRNA